ncbi:cell wall-binding repeat-containing protein [Cytobacillus firmus]|uniref:cell wall-binding repeat-containing protein n=1 Tax=Cytobacillus firmus TaxID=1399 RepID=UPI0024C11EC8|nr:cell wall-binding repeat-containing protein [Cytobacillus firmus]WHY61527.1 cell wall-binding repeat-containing protein [Cytobacillus firmus]
MKKSLYVFLSLVILIFFTQEVTYAESTRLSGKDRYETAVNISKKGWTAADTVVLAIGDNFPDALAGGPLAYKLNAPILLTKKNTLGEVTRKQISSLKAKKAVILGGKGIITENVESELRSMGLSIERIGGKDRYITAALIADKLGNSNKAIIAYGRNFPDALSIAPYAARMGYPILLSETKTLPEVTKEKLKGKSETIFVGGKGILADSLLTQAPNAKRVSGKDRYQTAVAIINQFQSKAPAAYAATGTSFADALTGSVLAAKNNGAMLLVQPTKLPDAIKSHLNSNVYSSLTALGGNGAVSNNVLTQMNDLQANNTFEKSAKIDVNKTYSAKLADYGDEDYYQFTITEPGNITLQLKQTSGASWYATILTANGDSLEDFSTNYSSGASGVTNNSVGLPKGTYYINIENYSDGYKVPYSFTIKYTKSNNYEKEMNNTIAAANQINVNADYKGALQDSGDLDYYKFTLAAPGQVELKMDQKPGVAWEGKLMNEKGEIFTYFSTDYGTYANGAASYRTGLPAGTYYFLIDHYSDAQDEEYKFNVQYIQGNYFEKEFNNTIETANILELNKSYKGLLSKSETVDFYKFTLDSAGKINVNVKNTPGKSWEVQVINRNGEPYAYFNTKYDDYASGYSNVPIGLPAGEYYLVIENYSSSKDAEYEIKVNFSKVSNYEKEFNNSVQSSNPISIGAEITGSIQSGSDNDFYSFQLDKPSTISLTALTKEDSSWYYEIVDGSGTTLNYLYTPYNNVTAEQVTETVSLPAGKYYIKIDNYSNSIFEEYSFSVKK